MMILMIVSAAVRECEFVCPEKLICWESPASSKKCHCILCSKRRFLGFYFSFQLLLWMKKEDDEIDKALFYYSHQRHTTFIVKPTLSSP